MKHGKWIFPASLCVLAGYVLVYVNTGENWISPRKAFLSPQLTTSLTGLLPKFVLAVVLLALTAALGRWYCRLLCPAGTVQEIFSRIGGALGLRKLRHAPAPSRTLLLGIVGIASVLGLRALAQLTDPIGLFARLTLPLSGLLPGAENIVVWLILIAGAALLVVLPLFKGRLFCDRFCPVGALLGVAARIPGRQKFSMLSSACTSCGKCAAVCPVQCADPARKTIDPLRCLDCGDCARVCPAGAIAAGHAGKAKERRSFLGSAVAGAAGIFALSRPASALIAQDASVPQITPPGTVGDTRHRQYCIGCQACAAACPAHVLRLKDGSGLRPVLDYDFGSCHYTCTLCLASCPAHAFRRLSPEERQRVRIARVRLELPRCVVLANGTDCGACGEVCPTHAVQMVPGPDGQTVPDFDPAYCIGCGACYHACPAEPRAFVVEGLAKHETAQGIRPPVAPGAETAEPRALPEPGELTDFPF